MPTPLTMLERPKPAQHADTLPVPAHAPAPSRSVACIPAPAPPGVSDAPDVRIAMLDKLSLAELPAHTALETERLQTIGMTTGELGVLEEKFTTLQKGPPEYPAAEAKLILEFFARLADPDLEEWLEDQRARGNFAGGRWPETEHWPTLAAPVYVMLAEKGTASGVATLNASEELTESQVPASVVSSSVTEGEVEGNIEPVIPSGTRLAAFLYAAKGNITIKPPTGAPAGLSEVILRIKRNGHTITSSGIQWIGGEPNWSLEEVIIALIAFNGGANWCGIAATAGPEGPEGKEGIGFLSSTGAPEESLGIVGQFYYDSEHQRLYGPKKEKASGGWGAGVSLIGKEGPEGSQSDVANVVLPWITGSSKSTISVTMTEHKALFVLAVIKNKGKKLRVYCQNGATVKGHLKVAVLDTGQAEAGKYTVVKEGAEVAQSGVNEPQLLATLEKTSGEWELGEVVLLGVMADNSESTLGAGPNLLNSANSAYPPGACPKGVGNLTVVRVCAQRSTYPSFLFATLSEVTAEATSMAIALWGHVE
jgi:hypothetical protein